MAKELKIRITGDATGLQKATDDGVGILGGFSQKISAMSVAAGNLLADGLKAGFGMIGGFVKDSVGAATDINETVSKVGVLFGSASGDIEKFAANAAGSLGQSKQQAMDAAATFATFGKSAGLGGKDLATFSTDLTALASDMASFSNTTPEDAIQAIGAALRGEAEPIRRYGVLLDDASLRQKALEMGIISTTKDALTPAQKVLASQALIMAQTSDAQGDFARTSGGLANQQRILAANVENLKTRVGSALLPTVLAITQVINQRVIPALSAWAETYGPMVEQAIGRVAGKVREMLPTLQRVADVIGNVLGRAFGWLRDNFDKIRNVVTLVGPPLAAAVAGFMAFQKISAAVTALKAFALAAKAASLALMANPIGLVVAGLAALVAGLVIAYRRSEAFRNVVNGLAERFMGFVRAVRSAFDQGGIGEAFRVALDGIKSALSDLGGWLASTALPWLGEQALALARTLGGWIGAAAGFLAEHLPGWLAALGEWIVGTALPWLGEQGLALAEKLGGWIGDAAGYLRENLPEWLGSFTEWMIGTALPWLVEKGAELALKLSEWVLDAAAKIVTNLPEIIAKISTWIITSGIPKLLGFGKDLAVAIKDGMFGALDFMNDIASNIVQGIIDGLWKLASRIGSEVKRFITENITDKIKDALKVWSPSRVTMGIGEQVAAGLALGIDRSATMVATAADNIAAAAVPSLDPFAPMAYQSAPGGNTYNFNITTAADPNAVVTAVKTYVRQNGSTPW